MSWEASAWAKKARTGSASAKALLMALADYADENGQCFPGQERLAWEVEVTSRTIRRLIDDLEALGAISRTSRFRPDGKRTSDMYTLHVGKPIGEMTPPPPMEQGERKTTTGQDVRRSSTTESDETTGHPEQSPPDTGVQVTPSRTTSNTTTNQPGAAGAAKRGTRITAEWQPTDEMRQWFREQTFATWINPLMETQKFVDYWIAQPGQRGVKIDWVATWRNWMRTAAQRAGWSGDRPANPNDPF